ncbi:hypothetical protein [Amycolatopsis sp. NPDC059657]|uniref:hypothetical protein n=1 Tax=Amycolatopsis sp. NPDC059657 TaxID=3346899 RepID=UPI00366F369E
MPKENITDTVQRRWRAEVTWRPESRFCRACATSWTAFVDVCDCSEYQPGDVVVSSGHVQLASVNLDSKFVTPANPADPVGEPAEPFTGWRVTLDQTAIERTIDALVRAGTQAFPDWKRDWSTDGSATP